MTAGNVPWAVLALACFLAPIADAAPPTPDEKPSTRPATKAEQAAEAFADGRKAFFRRDYKAAAVLLAKAVKLDGEKPRYQYYLGRALQEDGKLDEAIKVLAAIRAAQPRHIEAGRSLGEIYYGRKQWEKVAEVLEPLRQIKHDYQISHQLAEAYFNLGEYKKALKEYREALRLNDKAAEDWYQVGNLRLLELQYKRAADAYEKAAALGIDEALLHYKLGTAYFNMRNFLGVVAMKKIIGGKSGELRDGVYLLSAAADRKDFFNVCPKRSAVFQIKLAMTGGISGWDVRFMFANIFYHARHFKKVEGMYAGLDKNIPKGTPTSTQALWSYYRAQTAFHLDKHDEMLDLIEKAIKSEPKTYEAAKVEARYKIAAYHRARENYDDYIKHMLEVIRLEPQVDRYHLELGDIYHTLGRKAEALAQFKIVLELAPEHPQQVRLTNLITQLTRKIEQAKEAG